MSEGTVCCGYRNCRTAPSESHSDCCPAHTASQEGVPERRQVRWVGRRRGLHDCQLRLGVPSISLRRFSLVRPNIGNTEYSINMTFIITSGRDSGTAAAERCVAAEGQVSSGGFGE